VEVLSQAQIPAMREEVTIIPVLMGVEVLTHATAEEASVTPAVLEVMLQRLIQIKNLTKVKIRNKY